MKMFDVYNIFNVELVKAKGCFVYDNNGNKYLDFYGGHAVISIGHHHPLFVSRLKAQLDDLIFYSNAVINSHQQLLALKLEVLTGLKEHALFLCNSGAEANENALKLASFYNGRKEVIALNNAFHGRTSAAVNITDNKSIKAPINDGFKVHQYDLNEIELISKKIQERKSAAVIVEPIQGIGGLDVCSVNMLNELSIQCELTDTILIMDEVQSGFGRTGQFFAFQKSSIKPDIISMGKGMGNGFPVAGILVSNKIKAVKGRLGSTFGGNQLACVAAISVLEVIESENLMANVRKMGKLLSKRLMSLPSINEVKGEGLMLGCRFDFPVAQLRQSLVYDYGLFTGSSKNPYILRLLPPLCIGPKEINLFLEKMNSALKKISLSQTTKNIAHEKFLFI